jgi:hypothetical protein
MVSEEESKKVGASGPRSVLYCFRSENVLLTRAGKTKLFSPYSIWRYIRLEVESGFGFFFDATPLEWTARIASSPLIGH